MKKITKIKNFPKSTQKAATKKEIKFLDLQHLDKTLEAAVYYGFHHIPTPKIEKEDIQKGKSFRDALPLECFGSNTDITHVIEEKIALLRTYETTDLATIPQPAMVVYDGHIGEGKKTGKEKRIGLEILNTNKSIAEATAIKAAIAILEDNGYSNLFVEINSLGDKESSARFVRELTAYYRKNMNGLTPHCRQLFKKDCVLPLFCCNSKCLPHKEEAPRAVSCLSDISRQHFKEVLEFLEALEIPYKINDYLIPDRRFASQTVFEIKQKTKDDGELSLGIGYRYDTLSKKIGGKKEIPALGLKLAFKVKEVKKQSPKIKKAQVFFIQIGDEAKQASLKVIEILRKENIFINHSLSRDKLTAQLAMAERSRVPYVLIMGKREAMDQTVMIRNVSTRSQETIRFADLPTYLEGLFK